MGECEIINSFKITKEQAEKSFNAHQVSDLSLLNKWCYAWELSNVIKYKKPIPYCHPRGAVIWVKLN